MGRRRTFTPVIEAVSIVGVRFRPELLTKSLGKGQGDRNGPSFAGQIWGLLVHRLGNP